jgi:hypothetical protein
MILPLAHIGHYLWVFYLLPVVFVIAGIVKTTLSEKNRGPEDPAPQPAASQEEGDPPAGGREGGPRTDQPDRPQDPPP